MYIVKIYCSPKNFLDTHTHTCTPPPHIYIYIYIYNVEVRRRRGMTEDEIVGWHHRLNVSLSKLQETVKDWEA